MGRMAVDQQIANTEVRKRQIGRAEEGIKALGVEA